MAARQISSEITSKFVAAAPREIGGPFNLGSDPTVNNNNHDFHTALSLSAFFNVFV